MISRSINEHVKIREREIIFRAHFIQVTEVYADLDLAVLPFNRDDVGQPNSMNTGSDESRIKELLDFLLNLELNVSAKISGCLLNRFNSRISSKFVGD